jgi:hypothetical protein
MSLVGFSPDSLRLLRSATAFASKDRRFNHTKDRRFNHTTPRIGGWVGRVERRFRAATGRPGYGRWVVPGFADEEVTATGRAGGDWHNFPRDEPARLARRLGYKALL